MHCWKWTILFCSIFFAKITVAQIPTFEYLDSAAAKPSCRGLSVVSHQCFWISGSNGWIGKSTDAGKHILWQQIPGYENRDFRDIEALNDSTVLIMAVAEPAVILKTNNNGLQWRKVLEDATKGMFLDAMYFNGTTGIVIGDPLVNKAYLAVTYNAGEHWQPIIPSDTLLPGESFFAASGANLLLTQTGKKLQYCYVSGGSVARLLHQGKPVPLQPLLQGSNSAGANAIAKWGNRVVIVGGDFNNKQVSAGTCVVSNNHGRSFTAAQQPPLGYKSSVCFVTKQLLVACGTSGVDWSRDGGHTWQNISKTEWHVVQKAPKSRVVYLAGGKGRVAKITF